MRAFIFNGTEIQPGLPTHVVDGQRVVALGGRDRETVHVSAVDPPVFCGEVLITDASLVREPHRGRRPWFLVAPRPEDARKAIVRLFGTDFSVVSGDPPMIAGPHGVLVVMGAGDALETTLVSTPVRLAFSAGGVPEVTELANGGRGEQR